jgi:hypothetical protein
VATNNFRDRIQISSIDQFHSALLAAGHECLLLPEEQWNRRDDFNIGVRQFADQDPDGYRLR